ncbi:hypothetical protein PVK06_011942 [Gossypium arboreum]|uniref:Uncharacterized protein n=1 Tax=Gossypium arboreum TaxID=29729 RepID=A0ABR0QA18_GOSAR|nr:hypothetical protein PVK06_011942 [Gossypium arboreum]
MKNQYKYSKPLRKANENPNLIELFAEIVEPDAIQVVIPASQRSKIDFDLNISWEDQSGARAGIVIRNNPWSFMTDMDPDAALTCEFPEYTNIVQAHLLDEEFGDKELFMWMIRKLEGLHTCTIARMLEDHGKLDVKTICNCIIPLVKESPTSQVSVLILDMQARFKYKVSYRKAWWAK